MRLWSQPHQEALLQAAREALPTGLRASGTPSLHAATREVVLRVQGHAPDEVIAAASAAFAERTGWQLTLRPMG